MDVYARNMQGQTALHLAAQSLDSMSIQDLVRRGAEVDTLDAEGNTPLLALDYSLHFPEMLNVVRLLLEAGANLDATSSNGDTALHMSAANHRVEIMEQLLKSGADVNSRHIVSLETPLHRACQSESYSMGRAVKFLLNAGANILLLARSKRSPLESALRALLTAETAVAKVSEDCVSALCNRLRHTAEAIIILLEHYDYMPTYTSPCINTRAYYSLRDCQNLLDLPTDQARGEFREVWIHLSSAEDGELYRNIRNFRQMY